ncbi:MAG TPA: hypothetical protein VJA94_17590, partial [Candidatus Angelobacter sp.]
QQKQRLPEKGKPLSAGRFAVPRCMAGARGRVPTFLLDTAVVVIDGMTLAATRPYPLTRACSHGKPGQAG